MISNKTKRTADWAVRRPCKVLAGASLKERCFAKGQEGLLKGLAEYVAFMGRERSVSQLLLDEKEHVPVADALAVLIRFGEAEKK